MNTTGFGRRIVPSDARDLMLVATPAPEVGLRSLSGRNDLKERVRSILMSRIDPTAAGRIPRRTLRAEVALLVSAIATEEKVQLNEIEESALAVELTDDMVGLGPLEPLLQDDEITDILVNGPFDI
jgi:pilus assembly protein CpaF